MASALQQDWENYNPNNPTALRSPSYWDAVKENIPHQLTGLSRVGTNALGFPVDIINLGLEATDATYNLATGKTGRHLSSDYPFMGSRNFEDAFNIPERTGNPTDFWSEIGGEFLLPTGQGLARSALKAEEFLSKIVKDKLPEFVGKNVPELFKTPITGLNIKPKDSALSPNLSKEDKIARGIESQRELLPKYLYHTPRGRNVDDGIKTYKHKEFDEIGRDGKGIYLSQEPYDSNSVKIDVSKIPMRHRKDVDFTGQQEGYIVSKIDIPKEAIVTKQAPKIENLNFNELLTAWTVDQTKVPRKLLSDKLSTPENKNRTIKALNNLGYKDTVPIYRTVRYKGELKDEDLISASLTPEANINFTKFSTEGKTINPLSDNPVPQDFAILRYDVPINDVKGYLPEFAGDIKRTVNKKIKDLGIGQEKISGLKTVTNPSAHAKQLLSTQDEIIADVSKIKPKVLQHYGLNKNLNPLSSELSIPSEIAKGKITKPSDLPSNYSVLPFPKGGINAPKEAWAERKGEKLISYKVNKKDILASPNILRRGDLDESEIIINTNKVTKQE